MQPDPSFPPQALTPILPLFIYGTLHPGRAPAAIAATARRLRSMGKATVRGRVSDLGEYPGATLSSDPGELIHGELFLLPEGDAQARLALAHFDHYEDCRAADPLHSLFLREVATATLEDGSERPCWIYTFNR